LARHESPPATFSGVGATVSRKSSRCIFRQPRTAGFRFKHGMRHTASWSQVTQPLTPNLPPIGGRDNPSCHRLAPVRRDRGAQRWPRCGAHIQRKIFVAPTHNSTFALTGVQKQSEAVLLHVRVERIVRRFWRTALFHSRPTISPMATRESMIATIV